MGRGVGSVSGLLVCLGMAEVVVGRGMVEVGEWGGVVGSVMPEARVLVVGERGWKPWRRKKGVRFMESWTTV